MMLSEALHCSSYGPVIRQATWWWWWWWWWQCS